MGARPPRHRLGDLARSPAHHRSRPRRDEDPLPSAAGTMGHVRVPLEIPNPSDRPRSAIGDDALVDTGATNAWRIFIVTMASATAALLVINNLFGAACDVSIQTAVQKDNLVPLSRVKRAERALERIRPLILQAQGQFTPEETVLRLRELLSPRPAATPDPPAGLSAHP